MIRLNLLLFVLMLACALGTVTSQHKARKLYVELQQQQDRAQQYEVEWGQLQLEQSTWAKHSSIEKIATTKLHMRLPHASQIQMVAP